MKMEKMWKANLQGAKGATPVQKLRVEMKVEMAAVGNMQLKMQRVHAQLAKVVMKRLRRVRYTSYGHAHYLVGNVYTIFEPKPETVNP